MKLKIKLAIILFITLTISSLNQVESFEIKPISENVTINWRLDSFGFEEFTQQQAVNVKEAITVKPKVYGIITTTDNLSMGNNFTVYYNGESSSFERFLVIDDECHKLKFFNYSDKLPLTPNATLYHVPVIMGVYYYYSLLVVYNQNKNPELDLSVKYKPIITFNNYKERFGIYIRIVFHFEAISHGSEQTDIKSLKRIDVEYKFKFNNTYYNVNWSLNIKQFDESAKSIDLPFGNGCLQYLNAERNDTSIPEISSKSNFGLKEYRTLRMANRSIRESQYVQYEVYQFKTGSPGEIDLPLGIISNQNTSSTEIINDYHLGIRYIIANECSIEPIQEKDTILSVNYFNKDEFLWTDRSFKYYGKFNTTILSKLSNCRPSDKLNVTGNDHYITHVWESKDLETKSSEYKSTIQVTTLYFTTKVTSTWKFNKYQHIAFQRNIYRYNIVDSERKLESIESTERCLTHFSVERYHSLLNASGCFDSGVTPITIQFNMEIASSWPKFSLTMIDPETHPWIHTIMTLIWRHLHVSILRMNLIAFTVTRHLIQVKVVVIESRNLLGVLMNQTRTESAKIDINRVKSRAELPEIPCLIKHSKSSTTRFILHCHSNAEKKARGLCIGLKGSDVLPKDTELGTNCTIFKNQFSKLTNVLKEASTSQLLNKALALDHKHIFVESSEYEIFKPKISKYKNSSNGPKQLLQNLIVILVPIWMVYLNN